MKTMRNNWTKWAYGIPALVGVCLLNGCSTMEPEEPVVVVEPVPESGLIIVEEVEPIELPVVQVTTPYVVAKGDTLTQIAAAYGLRWQDVAAVNPGMNPNKLRIGQALHLPGNVDVTRKQPVRSAAAVSPAAPKTVTYKVQKGDSLSVIAYRYGVKVAALKQDNDLTSDRIQIGQQLKIVNPTKAGIAPAPRAAVKAPAVKAPAISAPKSIVTPVTVKPPAAPVVVTIEVPSAEVAPMMMPPPPAPEATLGPAVPITATSVTDGEADAFRSYKVQEGEDVFAVAIRWGVSPKAIKALNGLTGDDIQPGTTIKVPLQTQQQ